MELQPVVDNLWNHAISHNTRQTYETGYQTYIRFLLFTGTIAYVNSDQIPVTEDLLIFFVAHCVSKLGISYSTIKLYLCGIKFKCHENSIMYPAIHNLNRLKNVLNGVKRTQTKKSYIRYPITFEVLRKVCLFLRNSSLYSHLLLETVCTVAFFGFLRCGEFTVENGQEFHPSFNLCVCDMTILADCVHLRLKVSKTDPFRQGVIIKLFPTNNIICPFKVCTMYMRHRMQSNAGSQDPLFIDVNNVALSRNNFLNMLKHALTCVGYDSSMYSGHSFRIGAATTAGSVHVDDHLIKILGRWSSDAYCRYIRTPDLVIKQAQNSLAYQ